MVESYIATKLPQEKVDEITERVISKKVGMLTMKQAAEHLQCKNERTLTDFCRENRIPIEHFGAKKRFIRIADIEAAQARVRLTVSDPSAPNGTRIATT